MEGGAQLVGIGLDPLPLLADDDHAGGDHPDRAGQSQPLPAMHNQYGTAQ